MTAQRLPDRYFDDTTDRLGTLNEIGRAVAATLDLQTLYETIYEQIGRVMDTTLFFIALHEVDRSTLNLTYFREKGELLTNERVPREGSVTSLVIERGSPLIFDTLKQYQDFGRRNGVDDLSIGGHDPEAMIFVPLNTGNRTIGALSVQSVHPHSYSVEDVETLTVIASQAAVAIENARLYARSQANVRQTQALLNVARMINSSLDLETVLDAILEGMREVVPYYLAAILMPNRHARCLDIMGAVGPLSEERRTNMKIPFGEGITGQVFESGEPLMVNNIHDFDGYITHGILAVQAEMAVPLRRGDTIIGVLDVERDHVDSFTSDELDLLTLFASQAAIAIENARLFAAQQSRVFELQAIQAIVQKLTPLHDIATIAAVIDEELRQLIDYHACRMFLIRDDDMCLVPIDFPGTDAGDLQLQVGEGISGWIAQHGEPVIITNTLLDGRVTQIPGTPCREESMLGVPLTYEGRTRGVITLSRLGTDQFDTNALCLLEIIAAQAALAVDRARLYDELRMEAITDPLTKLYNRRHLFERFREERARALRNNHALSAIMLDIDGFKRVNDRHGHDAGDLVLQELARVVRTVVRTEDLVARYGGEEFCVLVPEIAPDEVAAMAERIRSVIRRHRLPPGAGVSSIAVSVGLAYFSASDTGHEVFSRADLAMYHVKRLGGNQVSVAGNDGDRVRYLDVV